MVYLAMCTNFRQWKLVNDALSEWVSLILPTIVCLLFSLAIFFKPFIIGRLCIFLKKQSHSSTLVKLTLKAMHKTAKEDLMKDPKAENYREGREEYREEQEEGRKNESEERFYFLQKIYTKSSFQWCVTPIQFSIQLYASQRCRANSIQF